MLEFADSHAHIYDKAFDEDRDEVIKDFGKNGVKFVVVPGSDLESSRLAVNLSQKYDRVYAAAGSHPDDIENFREEDLGEFEKILLLPKTVAVGEIGLDYYWDASGSEIQKRNLRLQMDLAERLNMPVIIHTREAVQDTFSILKEYKGRVRGVIHSYTGSVEMAREFIKLDYYISISGPVTFKNARNVVNMVRELDLNRIMVETDSPYMSPHPFRGKRNEPKRTLCTIEKIAEIKGVLAEKVCEISLKNTKELFNIW